MQQKDKNMSGVMVFVKKLLKSQNNCSIIKEEITEPRIVNWRSVRLKNNMKFSSLYIDDLLGRHGAMKKLTAMIFLLAALTLGCFALEDSAQNVHVTYDSTENLIKAEVSILTGDAIVGHFGLAYNTQKLELVACDGTALPAQIPEKGADGKSYLASVVQAAHENIVVTAESNKPADLIRPSAGKVLFGWYATKNIDAVTSALDGGRIAVLRFKLADGVAPSDLKNTDLTPVSASDCTGISGWTNGIIVINSQSKIFTAAAVDGTSLLKIAVTADFSGADTSASTDKPVTPPEKVPTPGDTDIKDPVKEPETDPEKDIEPDKDDSKEPDEPITEPTGKTESVNFGLQAHTYSEKIRFLWQVPENRDIVSYTLILKDSAGQIVRQVDNIIGLTKSITVSGLAPDYALNAELKAYTSEGTELSDKALSVRTERPESDSTPVAFTVTYDAGIGEFYGFDSEEVLFGQAPTKAPAVYAPDGYVFAGWSIDGENLVSLSESRIYEDVCFIAVFVPSEKA